MPAPSFPRDLRQFLRSVDTVDAALHDQVMGMVARFLSSNRTINYAEVMEVDSQGDRLALRTLWRAHNGDELNQPMEGHYSKQELAQAPEKGSNAAMSVLQRRRQWLVAPTDQSLDSPDAVDEWSTGPTQAPLGQYKPPTDSTGSELQSFVTSIILPLYLDRRVVGVLDLESNERLDPVQSAREEAVALAEALGTLIGMKRSAEHPLKLRKQALDDLERGPGFMQGIALTKPTLFFAWPNEAQSSEHGRAVLDAVRDVLHEDYESTVSLLDWHADHPPGHILDQIFKEIRGSSYGICYLSSPDPYKPDRYVDNANVLFEAGMLHAQVGDRWFPIREHPDRCATPPFDLAQIRHVVVPRLVGGTIDVEGLRTGLRKFLAKLFLTERS